MTLPAKAIYDPPRTGPAVIITFGVGSIGCTNPHIDVQSDVPLQWTYTENQSHPLDFPTLPVCTPFRVIAYCENTRKPLTYGEIVMQGVFPVHPWDLPAQRSLIPDVHLPCIQSDAKRLTKPMPTYNPYYKTSPTDILVWIAGALMALKFFGREPYDSIVWRENKMKEAKGVIGKDLEVGK
ncbi:hypothetical protein HDV00_006363 [Rhizophlyctis rosea]|nr:hypothetical protein HDV00_006363 [Rhizophlyctis rosea]